MIIFLPLISIFIDLSYKLIQFNFFPSPADILFKNQDYYKGFIPKEFNNIKLLTHENENKTQSKLNFN